MDFISGFYCTLANFSLLPPETDKVYIFSDNNHVVMKRSDFLKLEQHPNRDTNLTIPGIPFQISLEPNRFIESNPNLYTLLYLTHHSNGNVKNIATFQSDTLYYETDEYLLQELKLFQGDNFLPWVQWHQQMMQKHHLEEKYRELTKNPELHSLHKFLFK